MQLWMDVDIAIAEAPVNIMPLIDDTDFKTIEDAVAFDAGGMALIWHFVTTAGVMTETAVTPTTAGAHDWTDQGTSGLYALEIPASSGTINNDTEGFGWFTGVATGVLPWRGPIIGFRAAGLNNILIDDAFSATRALSGTALPDAVADAAGGLPISDLGGLDMDDIPITTEFEARTLAAAAYFDPAADTVSNVTLVATTTTNTDMVGTDSALLAANAPTNFSDLAITATTGRVTIGTNNDKTGYSISGTKTTLDALNDISISGIFAGGDIDGFSLEQSLKLNTAALAGKLSGAATSTNTIRAADDSKARITATVDADGNRTAVTLDVTG